MLGGWGEDKNVLREKRRCVQSVFGMTLVLKEVKQEHRLAAELSSKLYRGIDIWLYRFRR